MACSARAPVVLRAMPGPYIAEACVLEGSQLIVLSWAPASSTREMRGVRQIIRPQIIPL